MEVPKKSGSSLTRFLSPVTSPRFGRATGSPNLSTISRKFRSSAGHFRALQERRPLTWSGAAAWRQEPKYAFMQLRICRSCTSIRPTKRSYTRYMPTGQMQTDDQYFAALAGAGISVFVSSGDGGSTPGPGSAGDNSGPVQVESPAIDPNVTAVGGTSLYLNASTGSVSSESAWFYGGGGVSQFFARPSWQIGTGVPSGGTRLVPDVALAADPNTGAYLILN